MQNRKKGNRGGRNTSQERAKSGPEKNQRGTAEKSAGRNAVRNKTSKGRPPAGSPDGKSDGSNRVFAASGSPGGKKAVPSDRKSTGSSRVAAASGRPGAKSADSGRAVRATGSPGQNKPGSDWEVPETGSSDRRRPSGRKKFSERGNTPEREKFPESSERKMRGKSSGRKSPGGKKTADRVPEKGHPFEKFRREKPSFKTKSPGGQGRSKMPGDKKRGGPPEKSREPGELRLNRFIAKSGVCSRREADEHILGGHITVNDKVVKELGTQVTWSDVVRFKGKKLNPEKKIYLLLNKPKDYITTVDDPYAKRTVMELVRNSCRERIYPVGRLDRHSTGLLLFTNDGELTKKLTHPSHKVIKIYEVGLDRPLEKADLEKIVGGIVLEDGPVEVDEIGYIDASDKSRVGIQLHSGKNRIIRRIFKHFDYKVVKLDRVFFAGLTKKNLPRGKWRFLNEREVNMLNMNIFK